jgi:hypothetical protein
MIDKDLPTIPLDIFNLAQEDADLTYTKRCEELWHEVCQEVFDEVYAKRSHHNVGTYDKGCRGPLCRKALREHPRRRSQSTTLFQLREERIYDPVIEYFHVVIKHRVRAAQQELLKEIRESV